MTGSEMEAMLAWPGSYNYICQLRGHPTYTHTPCGQVLYRVTDEDRASMLERAKQ